MLFPGQSLDRAFRPSRMASREAPLAEESRGGEAERETRIRAYARRVKLRLPLFEEESESPPAEQSVAGV